jgi:DNA-binding transcriptional MerR regulator
MGLKHDKDLKLYYSIDEVAQRFGLNQSTLRFWEKEFEGLNPRKTPGGTRYYQEEDIQYISLIHHLVKERGMTLAGARQRLKDNKEATVKEEELLTRLKHVRNELQLLVAAFNKKYPEEND